MTFQATPLMPIDVLINDPLNALIAADTYSVTLALVGEDHVNSGYTAGTALSPVTGISVTAGQGIYIHTENADWPAGFDGAICAAVFIQINSGNYFLADFAYIDPIADFNFMVSAKPLRVAPNWSLSILTAATVDPILGSRAPYKVTYVEITPTTGTFNFRRPVVNVQVSPNNSPDFQVATARGTGVSFEALINDIKTFVQAAAGVYRKFAGDNSSTIYNANMSLNTAQSILRGNRSVQVFLPPDINGNQEVRLLIGMLTFNQIELTEAWSKSATTPVNFQFDPASLDRLINASHVEIDYLRS